MIVEEEGIIVPEEARYFPYTATFDFECYFDKEKAQELTNTDKLNWESAHVPLSVSVCRNVPGYETSKCFVPNGDPSVFITEFVQYLISISTKSYSLLCNQFAPVFEALKEESVPSRGITEDDQLAQILVDIQGGNIESGEDENSEEESDDDSRGIDLLASDDEEDEDEIESESEEDPTFLDNEIQEQEDVSFYRRFHVELDRGLRQEQSQQQQELTMYDDMLFGQEQTSDNKSLNELAEKLTEYLRELPVLGFYSGKYDLNAVEKILFPYLIEHHPIKFTVKRNNNHMCLKTDFLKLPDISNYLAPVFSYDQFLRAYECEHTKGFFPYEWVDGLDKLEETSLPPHAAFYSSLKNTNITEQEYEYCQQVWEENNTQSFEDFLVWYNNLDVVPFIEAVEKMSQFWRERKIDMFNDGISFPGLTLKYRFSNLSPQTYFNLFDQANSDLYHLIKDNNTGNPSIIFHRYHQAGETKIREAEKARLLSRVKKSSVTMQMPCIWALVKDMPPRQLHATPSRE